MSAPLNQAFRGASLYSGIFDTQEQPKDPQQDDSLPHVSGGTSQRALDNTSSTAGSESGPSATAASNAAGPSKFSGWSAALRFAPRRTAAASKAKPRPNVAFVASFAPVAPADAASEEAPKGSISRAPGVALKSSTFIDPVSASESVQSATQANAASTSGTATASTKPLVGVDTSDLKLTALALPQTDIDVEYLASQLAKHPVVEPPSFTLPPEEIERDKALARQAAAARGEARHHDEEGEEQDDEDVNGFFSTSAGKRAARKRNKRKRGNSPPTGPNMNAEYDPRVPNDYMAYKRLVYERRRAELEFRKWQQEQEERGYGDDHEERWDEDEEDWLEDDTKNIDAGPSSASAKTAAPSASSQPSTGEEAYARRVAMSATPSAATVASPTPAPVAAAPSSGEEAYQGRVAMTAAATGEEAYLRRLALSQPSAPGPPPGPPSGPPPSRPPQTSQSTTSSQPDSRQAAAAAIAARLASLHPVAAPASPKEPSDPVTFAERLMTSYGYVPGHGLGSSANGILKPLLATSSPTSQGRGSILNPASHAQSLSDAAKYGSAKASPVIVLLNMATPADLSTDELREELVEDVAGECGKFGIVKRVLPQVEEREVRVFVEFTGEAGSWKAVRGLEGRWFEGRQVKAFYYDKEAFGRGVLDLVLARNEG